MTISPDEELWTATLQHYTSTCEEDIVEIVLILAEIRFNIDNTRLKSIVHKYTVDEHCNVAEIVAVNIRNIRFDSAEINTKVKQRLRTSCTITKQGLNSAFSELVA